MFYIYTLGCKVNTYERSFIEDSMINAGFVKTSKDKANIFIINTCFVTNVAGNKSLKIIRQAKRLKNMSKHNQEDCETFHYIQPNKSIFHYSLFLENFMKLKQKHP